MAKIKIAVTGGIGSGKSTALNLIKNLGYHVSSCDDIVKGIYNQPQTLVLLEKSFPTVFKNGVLDRVSLSELVFSDKQKLTTLNQLIHPLVMQIALNDMQKSTGDVAFCEVPLLFENGYEKLFDHTLVIMRDVTQRIESVKIRSNLTEDQIKKRIKNQFNYEVFPNISHTLIYNNGDMSCLKDEIVKLIEKLISNN